MATKIGKTSILKSLAKKEDENKKEEGNYRIYF